MRGTRRIHDFVIAVGGRGTRLSSYFRRIKFPGTKILFPVGGKPLLGHLIDKGLSVGFRRIYLLTSYYEEEIDAFVRASYPTSAVRIVRGGEAGKRGGVTRVLSLIERDLTAPFVYSDGNILYNPHILGKIALWQPQKDCLANVVISQRDAAPTHSQVFVSRNKVLGVFPRLVSRSARRKLDSIGGIHKYYSLGLMAFDGSIFRSVPHFAEMDDLDFVVESLFLRQPRSVCFVRYSGRWVSIHTREDIDKVYNIASLFDRTFKNKGGYDGGAKRGLSGRERAEIRHKPQLAIPNSEAGSSRASGVPPEP